jgi:hypothetical protein
MFNVTIVQCLPLRQTREISRGARYSITAMPLGLAGEDEVLVKLRSRYHLAIIPLIASVVALSFLNDQSRAL